MRTILISLVVIACCCKPTPPSSNLRFEVYQDSVSEWRWRLQANNNKTIADSGEGYHNKADCTHGIEIIQKGATSARVEWSVKK